MRTRSSKGHKAKRRLGKQWHSKTDKRKKGGNKNQNNNNKQ